MHETGHYRLVRDWSDGGSGDTRLPGNTDMISQRAPPTKIAPVVAGQDHVRTIDDRLETRFVIEMNGPTIREPGGLAGHVKLHDLSTHGFRTEWPYMLQKGKRVWLKIPGLEALAAVVAWEVNYTIGCEFEAPLHPAVLARIIELQRDGRGR